jgi:hypothetical protein
MIMKLLRTLVAVCALAALSPAQNTNENAPVATNALAFDKDSELSVSYRSFTTAGGNWLRQLTDKGQGGARALKVSKDIDLGGNPLSAGTYKLSFRIDDDLVWHLVVLNDKGGEICAVVMNTERDDKTAAGRLSITPVAAAEGRAGALHVHFGPLKAAVAFTVGKGAAAPAAAPAKEPAKKDAPATGAKK